MPIKRDRAIETHGTVGKHVMTHTRKKASTRPGPSSERRDNSSLGPNGDNMDVAWPQRLLRFGRTKKIGQVISHRKDEAKRVTATGKRRKKSGAVRKTRRKQREKKRDRKSYPLRGRTAGSDEEGLDCHVLLTRVDDGLAEQEGSDAEATAPNDGPQKQSHKSKSRKDKRGRRKETKVTPKTKSRSNTRREEDVVYLPEPRKRRLASLNAEAVNSLLLDRGSDQHPPAKQAKRQHEEPANERAPLDANPAWSSAAGGLNSPQISTTKATARLKREPGRGSKRSKKKAKANRGDPRGCVSQASLDAPAPRRLAGLTAAALLKLTSTSATSKQRVKAVPTATVTTDSKAPVPAATPKPQTRVKLKAKGRSQKTRGKKGAAPTDEDEDAAAAACKDKADFEPKVEWVNGDCNHKLAEAGYPQRGMLGFQLKSVKEEQEETDLSPYYCCPPEGSVEYCHRLAFFLGQQAYGDPEGQPRNPALTPVKRECLVGSPTLAHAHPALTLSPHPCLCTAEHCFSSYYVHIAHPTHTGTPSAALAARPLNFAPSSLCPNRVGRSKLLGPRVGHAAGLAHPACCGPVGSPCYNEACRISGYAYRAMPPVASRGCSFSTGCTGCQHSIKTEGYSPSQGLAPSLPLSSLPLPSAPPSTQPKPHLPTLLPGRDQPPARLKLAKECPQATAKSSSAAASPPVSSGRTRLTQKQAPLPTPGLVGARQKVSRRRATNGWRPVGGPVEREVFIAGDEETALRQCYDGVERDGEVVRVRDTVLLRSGPRKKSLPYVAKISSLWEDPKTGELMMSLFWYYRPEHTQGGRDPSAHCEKEIFASRHQDENSVACIEDRCYVLPLAQYCRFCALLKRRAEGVAPGGLGSGVVVPCCADFAPPSHRCVPSDVDPQLVYLCRHVYDFRYGRILKNLQ
ncbi:bromo adjacent homology domain-containing 1 protein-like isoform X1 [Gadus macrocephalus]|uniref:bromo adjacent homology domain-containing 1 protein-like isoform X1 n=2 Tax=Gadus macrocephalus TaxID=80720 RepID=UPI0028CB9FDE|nr:bromo adjacent homology domain-containing 1 protein-like isoform X1 [Gadus macrocephalus]